MKKGNGLRVVGLIFMFLGFLSIGASGGYYYFNMQNNDKNQNTNKDEVKDDTKDTKKVTVISFANSEFSIPEGVDYKIEGEQLNLAGDTWYAIIVEYPYSYKEFNEKKDEYKDLLVAQGVTVESYEETKVNSNKYLVYRLQDKENGNAYVVIKEYTNTSSLLITFVKDKWTQLKDDDLKSVDDIISTAEIKTANKNFDRNLTDFNQVFEKNNAE